MLYRVTCTQTIILIMAEFGKGMLKEFFMDDEYTFINHGSYGTLARRVNEAKQRKLEEFESNPDKWFRRNNWTYYEESLQAPAKFLGADPKNIVFCNNATTGINTVLKSLPLNREDGILMNSWTYPNVKNTLQQVSERIGAQVYLVEIRLPIKSKEDVIEDFEKVITSHSNIKVAVIDMISSIPAVLMPWQELNDLCKKHNILVVLDGAHTPCQIPLKLDAMNIDFYVGNLHKWAYTHRGLAVLYVHPSHQSYIDPLTTSAHLHHEDFRLPFHYQGTDDSTSYYVVDTAMEFIKDLGGQEAIHLYNSTLVSKAADMLVKRWGTRKMDLPSDMEAPYMRMVRLPEMKRFPVVKEVPGNFKTLFGDLKKLIFELMDRFHMIAVCIFLQNEPYVRLSANIYNCMEDYEKLADAIMTLKEEGETDK